MASINVIPAIDPALAEYSMTTDLSHYVRCYLISTNVYQNLSCGYCQRQTLLMSTEIYFSTRCGILRGYCLYFLLSKYQVQLNLFIRRVTTKENIIINQENIYSNSRFTITRRKTVIHPSLILVIIRFPVVDVWFVTPLRAAFVEQKLDDIQFILHSQCEFLSCPFPNRIHIIIPFVPKLDIQT